MQSVPLQRCSGKEHMHQEKMQEGIYTAMEMCDECYTGSNFMLQLIFFSNSRLKAYYNNTYQ